MLVVAQKVEQQLLGGVVLHVGHLIVDEVLEFIRVLAALGLEVRLNTLLLRDLYPVNLIQRIHVVLTVPALLRR